MSANLILEAERFLGSPLAMEPGAIQAIASVVSRLKAGGTPVAASGSKRDAGRSRGSRSVAVLPIIGPITPHANLFSELFGGAPLDALSEALNEALSNDAYGEIVLWIDSPGGSVLGTQEFADKVFAGRKKKRITAVADGLMASAAYLIGSQANELVASPSSMVGSIGVFNTHVDYSGADAAAGVKVTLISSTPEKVAANGYEPLSDLGRSQMQAIVDGYYRQFLASVSRGRNVGTGEVQSRFGKGGVVLAADAVSRGMADRVGTLEAVLQTAFGRANGPTAGVGVTVPSSKVDLDLQLRKRKLMLSIEDDKRRLEEMKAKVAAYAPPPPPPKPVLTRPSDRTAERDKEVAYHEAGHAIVALALGVPVFKVTVQPEFHQGDGLTDGYCEHAGVTNGNTSLCITLAGVEATRMHLNGTGYLGGGDAEKAYSAPAGAREQEGDRARRILRDNWQGTRAVAAALLTHRTLTGDELRAAAGPIVGA